MSGCDPCRLHESIWQYIEHRFDDTEMLCEMLYRLRAYQGKPVTIMNQPQTCVGLVTFADSRTASIHGFASRTKRMWNQREGIQVIIDEPSITHTPKVVFCDALVRTTMCFHTGQITAIRSRLSRRFSVVGVLFIIKRAMNRFLRRKHRRLAVSAALDQLRVLLPELDPFVVAYTGSV